MGDGLIGKCICSRNDFCRPYVTRTAWQDIKDQSAEAHEAELFEEHERATEAETGSYEKVTHVLIIPLNGTHRTFGAIRAVNKIDRTSGRLISAGFDDADREALGIISTLTTATVTNIKKEQRLNMIAEISGFLEKNNEKTLYDHISKKLVGSETLYSACLIHTLDDHTGHLKIAGSSQNFERLKNVDKDKLQVPIGKGICGRTFLNQRFQFAGDLRRDPEGFLFPEWINLNRFVSMLCVPLSVSSRRMPYGTLSLFTSFQYTFDPEEIFHLTSLTSQISICIRNIQEKRERALISEVAEHINSRTSIHDTLVEVASALPSLVGCDRCRIFRFDSLARVARVTASSDSSSIGQTANLRGGSAKEFATKKRIRIFSNIRSNRVPDGLSHVLSNSKALIFMPVTTPNAGHFGAIVIDNYKSTKARSLRNINRDLLQILTNQIRIAVDKNYLLQFRDTEIKRSKAVQRVLHQISSGEDLDESLEDILRTIVGTLGGDSGYISLLTKDSTYLIPTISLGIDLKRFPKVKIGDDSISATVYRSRQTCIWYRGVSRKPLREFIGSREVVDSAIVAPMLYDDNVIGLLAIGKKDSETFDNSAKQFVNTLATETALNIQNKRFHVSALKLAEVRFIDDDPESICTQLASVTSDIIDAPVTCVWLRELSAGELILQLKGWYGVDIPQAQDFDIYEHQGGVSWTAVKRARRFVENPDLTLEDGLAYIIEDIYLPEYKYTHPEFAAKHDLRSMVSMPLVAGKEILGVINTYARRRYNFFDKETALLENLASRGAIALKNAELTARTKEINEKILGTAQLANPGIVALSFTHDAKHTMNHINALLSSLIHLTPQSVQNSDEGRTIIQSLTKDTDYLRNLFNSLVSYASSAEVSYQSVKIKDIIDFMLYIHAIRLGAKRISTALKFIDTSDSVTIECNTSEVEQVFLNLFNNAIYAIDLGKPKGAGQIRIRILSIDHNRLRIEFSDNGIGIPREYREKIFDPLFTTKGSEGSGFGLAICRRIIEDNHLGKIYIKSRADTDWTTFVIEMPRSRFPKGEGGK